MPLGTSEVHLNVPLTKFALQYDHPEYLVYQIAPAINVTKEADIYYIFDSDRQSIVRPDTLRAIGAPSNAVKLTRDTDTYLCEEYSLHYPLPDRIRKNQDAPLRLEQRGVKRIVDGLDLDKEMRLQAMYQTFGGAGQPPGANVTVKWNAASGDPEADIQAAKEQVRKAIGKQPNSLLISAAVGDAIVRKIKAALTAMDLKVKLTFIDLPAVLWGLKVYIGEAVVNTANPTATPVVADIWNDNAVVFYQDPSPAIDVMSFVYTFQSQPHMVTQWREDRVKSDIYEASRVEVEKIVAPTAAYVLGDTL